MNDVAACAFVHTHRFVPVKIYRPTKRDVSRIEREALSSGAKVSEVGDRTRSGSRGPALNCCLAMGQRKPKCARDRRRKMTSSNNTVTIGAALPTCRTYAVKPPTTISSDAQSTRISSDFDSNTHAVIRDVSIAFLTEPTMQSVCSKDMRRPPGVRAVRKTKNHSFRHETFASRRASCNDAKLHLVKRFGPGCFRDPAARIFTAPLLLHTIRSRVPTQRHLPISPECSA